MIHSIFLWDTFNRSKCLKHGLTIAQIESFLMADPNVVRDSRHSQTEDRYIAFGNFDLRYLFVVFTLRSKDSKKKIRVISARFAREKEIKKIQRIYEKSFKE